MAFWASALAVMAQVGGGMMVGYSAVVFAVAAFAQLPVGSLLDRFGGRPVFCRS